MTATDAELARSWMPRLRVLSDRLRDAARGALVRAVEAGNEAALRRQAGQGAGDVTYGIDVPAERALSAWLEETARETPLSLLSEETGWRHMGPGASGRAIELAGFDHGGPRIVVDPIDGTRNLMTDLRSAWSVIGLAGAGSLAPRMSDMALGVLSEIPDSRAARFRRLSAVRGGKCRFELCELDPSALVRERGVDPSALVRERGVDPSALVRERGVDLGALVRERDADNSPLVRERELDNGSEVRVDQAYFPFFKYMPDLRPEIAGIEARFFARLAQHEGADVRSSFDDQYMSNGGQLALLALGTYRMIADLRAYLAERRGRATLTSKPYDIAGALVCARAAGCVITTVVGSELDFPIDTETPVAFVGWVNAATQRRLAPHLEAALAGDPGH